MFTHIWLTLAFILKGTKSPVEEQANKIGPDQNSVGNLDEEERSHDVVEMIEDLGEEYHYEDEFEEVSVEPRLSAWYIVVFCTIYTIHTLIFHI